MSIEESRILVHRHIRDSLCLLGNRGLNVKQLRYLAIRVLQMIPVLLVVTIIIFWGIRMIPGNPAVNILGEKASEEAIHAMEIRMGLDKPVWEQYLIYMKQLLHFDLGTSLRLKESVSTLIFQRSGVTILYTVLCTFFTMIIGIPMGYIAGTTPKKSVQKAITSTALVILSLPEFWFGILLLLLFGLKLGIVPIGGWGETPAEHIYCMLLPAFTGAIGSVGLLIRNIQSAVEKLLSKDYVNFARSKGTAAGIIRNHYVMKNVMVSTMTLIAMRITSLLGGSVVIESVYALPGLGKMLVDAINGRDYVLVQGTVLVYAVVVMMITLLTDLIYCFIDPRISMD